MAAWIGRGDGPSERSELLRLTDTASALREAGGAGSAAVAARHALDWQRRFADLLQRLDDAERETAAARLRQLVREHSAGDGPAAPEFNLVSGENVRIQADHGSVAAGTVNGDVRIGFPHSPDSPQG
ncbi:hypothetical protein ACIQRS_30070 [Streptomyces termitum]|uniref:hypothetical protein n=1 Tax=Streptomyces termitum TaxID=67368 RepID=UPI001E4E61B3|nr:hypothetical protein [Streptomyces termitum]